VTRAYLSILFLQFEAVLFILHSLQSMFDNSRAYFDSGHRLAASWLNFQILSYEQLEPTRVSHLTKVMASSGRAGISQGNSQISHSHQSWFAVGRVATILLSAPTRR